MSETPGSPGSSTDATSRRRSTLIELAVLVVLSLLLVSGVKHFVVQVFYVPSTSMEPTLAVDDRILVEKWSQGPYDRGDVVVFDDPGGWLSEADTPVASNPFTRALELVGLYPTTGHLVKRVIAVGGDRVACCDPLGRVTVNGLALDEPYIPAGKPPSRIRFDSVVPADHYWLMGDNRDASADSRVHLGDPGGGMVPESDVVGRVWRIAWPPSRFGPVEVPAVFSEVPAP
ncbi:signal peptidase I [Nocardioidaceae bacterium]|nr:signal peptidase I [Nocardioidaceae bacterium]